MFRYKALWSIPNAGPSMSQFHFISETGSGVGASVAAVRAFFAARAALIPNDVTVSFDTGADEINIVTGQLIGSIAFAAPAPVVGTGAGTWAAGAGVRVDWLTAGFLNGRRVRGRTFLVPAVSGAFGTDGRVLPAQVTATTADAQTLRTACEAGGAPLGIYHRPIGASPGSLYQVSAGQASGLAATLRGRKY